jgi:hypothetical protein
MRSPASVRPISADRAAGLDPISAFFVVRDATRAHLRMIADEWPVAAPIVMPIEVFGGPLRRLDAVNFRWPDLIT